MPDGGFLVKFGKKKELRCYAITLHYDRWEYKVNNLKKRKLPLVKKVIIKIEEK